MNSLIIILGVLGTTEIIIILILVLLLFGGRKIPELMRGLGRGVKEFKSGMNDDPEKSQKKDEENKETK